MNEVNLARWDRLPIHIWEKIFSLLPISSIIIFKTVCRSWKSIVQSELFISCYRVSNRSDQDLFFLLFATFKGIHTSSFAAAYHPSRDRWIAFPFSRRSLNTRHALVSDGSLLLLEQHAESLFVYNIFNRARRPISPMISGPHSNPYVLGLIEESSSRFKIVAVFVGSDRNRMYSQIYDSETGFWAKKGQLFGPHNMLGNTAYMDGLLYCLSHGPNSLLAFDPIIGEWSLVTELMPNFSCSHLLVYQGAIFLVAGIEEVAMDIVNIIICVLNSEKQWMEICSMPEPLFKQFCGRQLYYFETVHRSGKICLYNPRRHHILMYDMLSMRWWLPSPCPYKDFEDGEHWFGHALEPHIEVVL